MHAPQALQETAIPHLERIPRTGPMLFSQLVALYLNVHLVQRASYPTIRRLVRQHFGEWRDRPIDSITKLEILQWFTAIGKKTPTYANKALGIMRSMYNRAIEWDLVKQNPTAGIKKFARPSRTRFAQSVEMPRLLWAITTASTRDRAFFTICLLTGARRGEVRAMRWTDVDLVDRRWTKPTTKNGQPHTVPLPEQVVEAMMLLPQHSPWVFPGEKRLPISASAISKAWGRLREVANLPDLTVHDLRRTCASLLAIKGVNLPTIQRVLNHTSLQPTAIYARLNTEAVDAALQGNADDLLPRVRSPFVADAKGTYSDGPLGYTFPPRKEG